MKDFPVPENVGQNVTIVTNRDMVRVLKCGYLRVKSKVSRKKEVAQEHPRTRLINE